MRNLHTRTRWKIRLETSDLTMKQIEHGVTCFVENQLVAISISLFSTFGEKIATSSERKILPNGADDFYP